jgi:4-hydroxybutyrate dehydrogenase/sulfolactaldehyde 3-reductase
MRIAFLGLGTMGAPMARRLIERGFEVAVYDISETARMRFTGEASRIAASPAETARDAEVVITMLPAGNEVRDALIGRDGALDTLPRGALVIDMSTVAAGDSDSLAAELLARGMRMIDAPVGRLPIDAAKGTLLIMAGGDAADIAAARPIFEALGDTIHHLGPRGSGIRMKLVNNYMTMVGMVLTGETLTLAEAAGLDRRQVVAILQSTTAGRGPINVNYPRKVLAGDVTPDFPMRMALKDVDLALTLGAALGAPLGLGAVTRELFASAAPRGRSEQDMTAMLLLLQDMARETRKETK